MVDRPVTSIDEVAFWRAAEERRLAVQACLSCGALRHPPRPMCPRCGSLETGEHDCVGDGTVLAAITSTPPNGAEATPRIIVLVELQEGVRLVSNLVEPADPGPYEGRAVRVDFLESDGAVLPVFCLDPVAS